MSIEEEKDSANALVKGSLEITDVFGIGKAFEKLSPVASKVVEVFGAGAGKIYEPFSVYLNSRAEGAGRRKNALADAKAYSEVLATTQDPDIIEAMKSRILLTEYRNQVNIISAQYRAVEHAQAIEAERVHEVDPDFATQWTEGVKGISSEELQDMWARLLARAPLSENGSVPKPSLDLLRQMDGELAHRFRKIAEQGRGFGYSVPVDAPDADAMLSEIGAVSVASSFELRHICGWLSLRIEAQGFYISSLGTRASRLADSLFGKPDPEVEVVSTLQNLESAVTNLTKRPWVTAVFIRFRASDGIAYEAKIESENGQIRNVHNPLFEEADVLLEMDEQLTGRIPMVELAKAGVTPFVERHQISWYGIDTATLPRDYRG